MKKLIIGILIVALAVGGFVGYKALNNPLDTLNYATWDKVPEDTRTFFASFFDGDMKKGEEFYKIYFMKFNPVHEVSHGVRGVYDIETDLYDEEQSVNDITVAYWREIGEEEFINELEAVLKEVLSKMENPVPEGRDTAEYFNAEYHNLGGDPSLYGYFQFSFVLNSIEKDQNLYEALKKNVSLDTKEKSGNIEVNHDDVAIIDPVDVVNNYVNYLGFYNVESPEMKFNNKFRATIQSID
ncbi:hypothetical protein [Vallitalea okinawensis]|uniref:hypothetical protein n=1 Tax=Vallitalea okinawensis TaxID=2078660 RepID=UPI000CFDF7B4|nr:hypothetical protein [Vallitalea okinawensis]